MGKIPSLKTIAEPGKEVKVCRECDVAVVGGGPGGIGAAVSAARNGADTVLIERYGYLGGMGTGGLVTIIPNLSDISGAQKIAGLQQEWIDRLDTREAAAYPPRSVWGSDDERLVSYWNERVFFYVRLDRVIYSALIDAEVSKCVLADMVNEAGVKTYLHSWCTRPIVDHNTVKGIIFESKSGRQAVLAKVIIDCTGDGDLLPFTPAEFEQDMDPNLRIANLALCFWVDGVNYIKMDDFRHAHPQKYQEMMQEVANKGGQSSFFRSNLKNQENIVWFHNRYPNSGQTDVEELTRVEFLGRQSMLITHDFFKKNVPGFENSFIVLSAPQLGTRGSRRVHGDYRLTAKDLASSEYFSDTIAVFPDLDRGEESMKHPLQYIPYRTLLPTGVENLLVACRAFSSDKMVNNYFNLIPHCVAFGEAAGTAAALAIDQGASVRTVNVELLRKRLLKQNVLLQNANPEAPRKASKSEERYEAPSFRG